MTDDFINPSRQTVVNHGAKVLLWLMQGPKEWETTPAPYLAPENIGASVAIGMAHPDTLKSSWVETQQMVCLTTIKILCRELEAWAVENDRPEFLVTVGELIEQAVLASDEP